MASHNDYSAQFKSLSQTLKREIAPMKPLPLRRSAQQTTNTSTPSDSMESFFSQSSTQSPPGSQ